MYDLYELKNHRWIVVDTFRDLAEAIEYFGDTSILQVSGGVYTVNVGEGLPQVGLAMLRMLIECKVA